MRINSMLLIDFYKSVHSDMIPKRMTKSVSYFTPRGSRVDKWNEVVMYGLQAFIKEYLIDDFNENFFNMPKDYILSTYQETLANSLDKGCFDIKKIEDLYDLGYLPIEIRAIPEGTLVPIHMPMLAITNTHDNFAWLPQALECLISTELWYPMICATVGKTYRDIVNKWYNKTCEDNIPRAKALSNFDMRGDTCLAASLRAAGAWTCSFANTSTVPAIPYMKQMYGSECCGTGSVSTEHFVMCSNYAVDGDEITFLRKMLTEIYPNTSFSAVLDSYDYWNVIDNIIPQLHEEIMAHNGCMLMRGDSGECEEVVTKTVFKLWDEFGGTVNNKGYKVLDPHVKAIYGDSITVQRAEKIYEILEENGFAASNVALGVGSFSMHCIEENGQLKPFTRDIFSMAIKACYAEIDGQKYMIHKEPKEASFKKSHKGCCIIKSKNRIFTCEDNHTWEDACADTENMLKQVFYNGELVNPVTLDGIRAKLWNNKF